jgi:hypothetical protein
MWTERVRELSFLTEHLTWLVELIAGDQEVGATTDGYAGTHQGNADGRRHARARARRAARSLSGHLAHREIRSPGRPVAEAHGHGVRVARIRTLWRSRGCSVPAQCCCRSVKQAVTSNAHMNFTRTHS